LKAISDEIKDAMIKKAKGYTTSETVEEYQDEDGNMVLTKKKVTKKHVPPDTQAAKMLIDLGMENSVKNWSDEELETEKIRLLKLLKEYENETAKN
jgi:hypothetical protein